MRANLKIRFRVAWTDITNGVCVMARFIYRKEHETAPLFHPALADHPEMLSAKLAAAEAKLDELKSLLEEAKEQRDRWQRQAERVASLVQDQNKNI